MTEQEFIQQQAQLFDACKDTLMKQYEGKYVLFENGVVLDSGDSRVEVSMRAYQKVGMRPLFIERVISKVHQFTDFYLSRSQTSKYEVSFVCEPIERFKAKGYLLSICSQSLNSANRWVDSGQGVTFFRADLNPILAGFKEQKPLIIPDREDSIKEIVYTYDIKEVVCWVEIRYSSRHTKDGWCSMGEIISINQKNLQAIINKLHINELKTEAE